MAAISFAKVYNFARLNPGMACAVLGVGWPLTIAIASMLVLLSPLLFPAAMIAAYVLKYAEAPLMEEKRESASAPAAAPRQLSARMELYYEEYPEVAPPENSGMFYHFARHHRGVFPGILGFHARAGQQSWPHRHGS